MKNIIKTIIIISECVICCAALLLISPFSKVSGQEQQDEAPIPESLPAALPDALPDTTMNMDEFVEAGELPTESTDISSFIETYLGDENSDDTEPQSEVKPTNEEEYDFADEKAAAYANDWRLILVNKQNYVPDDYEMNLVNINGSMQVDERIAEPLAKMLNAAREDGVSLMICSAYRSYDRQTTLFHNKVNRYKNSGMSYMDAYAKASNSVTVPGSSEHQLGLALDIVTPGHTSLTDDFADTEAGKWLNLHCAEYGFILRYPEGKEYVTGIIYEPWHFRYVGVEYAKEIMENNLTLEEFLELKGIKNV